MNKCAIVCPINYDFKCCQECIDAKCKYRNNVDCTECEFDKKEGIAE